MSAQPVPVPQILEMVFRLRPDVSGSLKPFLDTPQPELHVGDTIVYKSPDGAVELNFVTSDAPNTPASPFEDGSIKVTSTGSNQPTASKRLAQKGRFFCFCTIIRQGGERFAWNDLRPVKGHGADHDILPPRP